MQVVSFIAAMSMAHLSPTWCASAATYRDSCGAQDNYKRNALFRRRGLL